MNRTTLSRASLVAALSLSVTALTGCYMPGGNGFSTGTHTFPSTSWEPKTVTLVDTRTGQNIWSVDVPVGQQLVVRFRPNSGQQTTATPEIMEWQLMTLGNKFGALNNAIPVPGGINKRIDWTLRPAPELPPDMAGAQVPVADPGQ